jgi:hypothetical protein
MLAGINQSNAKAATYLLVQTALDTCTDTGVRSFPRSDHFSGEIFN